MSAGFSLLATATVRSEPAGVLGLSTNFIRQELRSGEISNAFQVGTGRHWKIPTKDAHAYITRLTGTGAR